MGVVNNNRNGLSKMFYSTHSNSRTYGTEIRYLSFDTCGDGKTFSIKKKKKTGRKSKTLKNFRAK